MLSHHAVDLLPFINKYISNLFDRGTYLLSFLRLSLNMAREGNEKSLNITDRSYITFETRCPFTTSQTTHALINAVLTTSLFSENL